MLPSFIITLRETLEAVLIISIVFSFLRKSNQQTYYPMVRWGIISAVIVSVCSGVILRRVAGGLTGQPEQIFEGIVMLVGAALLTTMIMWMQRQRSMHSNIQSAVGASVARARKLELWFVVFIMIVREGIETVIYLQAASFVSATHNLWGALTGIVIAAILGVGLYLGSIKLNMRMFFTITTVILVLFAAGLVSHGVHEFQEIGWLPGGAELWNINPPLLTDGTYPLLHERGYIGSFLVGLFGYNGNPSGLEIASYLAYLSLAITFIFGLPRRSPVMPRAPENA